jgi:CheY-like chemotaxis protein
MIEATLKTVGPLVRVLGAHVVSDTPEGLPPVAGQRVLLRQAFLSLLTAAVHATPGGQIRVWAEQKEEDIIVSLEADSGKPSAADSSGTEHLQMARQCIDLFGGKLLVETQEDRSFATALLLPVTEPVPILVIDDNLDTLHLFQRYLLGTRYQFFGVHDPEAALSVAESVLPEAIVLDVMLPEIDGWELLGRLREHPVMRALPIIVCTVMPQEQLALALGAADYLRKPVSREMLLSTLDRQVSSRRTRFG